MIKRFFITTIVAISFTNIYAQQSHTLDELIVQLIENNYTLKISAERTNQAQNNVNLSPLLPTITANARQNQNSVGTTTNTYGVGAAINWRLFDGMAMFATRDRQKKLLDTQRLYSLEDLEDLVRQLKNQYYLIVSLDSRAKVARELVSLSRRRYEETVLKYSIEAISGLEMKLAKTDLNADSTYLIRQIEALDVAYINLNRLLNQDFNSRGYVCDSIVIASPMKRNDIEAMIAEQNTQILLAQKGAEVADLNLRIARSAIFPTLDFGAGYNYSAVNQPPETSFSTSNGANWGFTLGVKLFDGLEVQRGIKNSGIDKMISRLNQDNVVSTVMASFNSQFVNYTNNLQLIGFEKENADAMRLNLDVAMERYRLGELSGLDFRNIQQQYLSAEDRRINAQYLAKISEIALQTLAGIVVEPNYSFEK